MASLNKVFLVGNLTRDPEVRYTPGGMAVADIGLAVSERYKDSATNEWKEKVVYVDIVVWGRQAETAGEYLSKGSPVLVEGRLQLDQWENPQGEKRSKLRVNASRLQFLGSQRRPGSGDEYADAPGAPADSSVSAAPPAVEDEDDLPF